MIDDTYEGEGDESFAELFEQSLREKPQAPEPGQKVTGRVVQVGAHRVLLDLGGGVDGMIELSEIAGPGEPIPVKPGDRLEAYVVRISNRVAELARSLGKGVAAKAALEEAAQTGVPVEGTITAVNKGGYVVEVAGERAFCPLGQMDVRRIDDPATMIGRKLPFRIAEWRGGRDIVLSRRALLEEEQAAAAAKTRERLEVGARFSGTVTRVMEFGAFVDIGGIEGLVHASELGYGRHRPAEILREGQPVEVEVLRIEAAKDGKPERISLSMRAIAEDPFDATVDELPEGTIVEGKVVRIQPFGAFVEIVPGVEGLLHVSAFGRRVAHPSDVIAEGQEIPVRIDAVDKAARRISLSYVEPAELEAEVAAEAEAPAPAPAPARKAPAREPGPGFGMRRRADKGQEAHAAPR
ncbi:MAG TPA: S1 RNA-binding domain-containing protein, partial [Vulgatibacter sp.]